jgi:phage shock protein C
MNGRLYRSRRDRVLAGVAGGLADYLDVDPSLVRVVWAILILFSGGVLLLVYILMAIIVPEEPAGAGRSYAVESGQSGSSGSSADTGPRPDTTEGDSSVTTRSDWGRTRAAGDEDRPRWERRERRGSGGLLIGIILIVVGGIFLVREYVPALDWDRLWPIILIAIGAVLLLAAISGRDRRGWGRP